jgi:hypothetical protein
MRALFPTGKPLQTLNPHPVSFTLPPQVLVLLALVLISLVVSAWSFAFAPPYIPPSSRCVTRYRHVLPSICAVKVAGASAMQARQLQVNDVVQQGQGEGARVRGGVAMHISIHRCVVRCWCEVFLPPPLAPCSRVMMRSFSPVSVFNIYFNYIASAIRSSPPPRASGHSALPCKKCA